MPNILIKIPQGAFNAQQRERMLHEVTQVALDVEQIGQDPRQRALCWVLLEELAPGTWRCGGADLGAQALSCLVQVKVPAGVLDSARRQAYVAGLHQALAACRPAEDGRLLMTSILLDEVPDGTWGANGTLWHLADFTRAAGYRHLSPANGQ
ncbi:tautomerase family protein [Pseudomonas sp. LD120]|uniref:tautomerase family protein n=1 Tax=Pseudomonas sp. LD120 TaxID=485751 RepID=UPI0015B739D3|nr:tautomerase family protein [Pseudomonas sp. LD120]